MSREGTIEEAQKSAVPLGLNLCRSLRLKVRNLGLFSDVPPGRDDALIPCVMLFLIPQMAAGEIHKHVFKRGVVSGKGSQGMTGLLQVREQQGQCLVHVFDSKRKPNRMRFDRMHAREAAQAAFIEGAITFDFHYLGAAERLDQFARCAQGDHLAFIHDGHAIAKALRFIHVVSGQQNRPALAFEALDKSPKLPA